VIPFRNFPSPQRSQPLSGNFAHCLAKLGIGEARAGARRPMAFEHRAQFARAGAYYLELGRQRGAEARQAKAASRTADLPPVINAIRADGDHERDGDRKGAEPAWNPDEAMRPLAGRAGATNTAESERSMRAREVPRRARVMRPACSEYPRVRNFETHDARVCAREAA